MPSYKVLTKGFHGGITYDPEGKRRVLHTDKPFKKTPSWLQPLKAETASQKKKREADEAKTAKANVDKAGQDKADIDSASFMGGGESNDAGVETL